MNTYNLASFARCNKVHPADLHKQIERVHNHRRQLGFKPYTKDQAAIAAMNDLVNGRKK